MKQIDKIRELSYTIYQQINDQTELFEYSLYIEYRDEGFFASHFYNDKIKCWLEFAIWLESEYNTHMEVGNEK